MFGLSSGACELRGRSERRQPQKLCVVRKLQSCELSIIQSDNLHSSAHQE